MKTNLYYFTGTGNSLNVAKNLKKHLEKQDNEIVELLPIKSFNSHETININADRMGIIFPTYDLDAPRIVKSFTKKVRAKNNPYVFIYSTSAGLPGLGIFSIKQLLNESGIVINNAFTAVYNDNSVLKKYSADEIASKSKNAEHQHKKDSDTILNNVNNFENKLLKYNVISKIIGKAFDMILKKYYGFDVIIVNDQCTSCGICEKICPVNNIKMTDSIVNIDKNCEMCFACIHACPAKALSYKRMPKRSNYQYRHHNVSLEELL